MKIEEQKTGGNYNFEYESDYSDYEDDFESDDEEESTALESTGSTPNLNKPPSQNQQQELDRVVQTYQEFLEDTVNAEVSSGFSQYEFD